MASTAAEKALESAPAQATPSKIAHTGPLLKASAQGVEPKQSKFQRFRKQAGIILPKYLGQFEEFAFKQGYKNFLLEVQKLNNNSAPRAKVESAWKSIIHKKYHLWKPKMEEHLKVRSKNLALKQVKLHTLLIYYRANSSLDKRF